MRQLPPRFKLVVRVILHPVFFLLQIGIALSWAFYFTYHWLKYGGSIEVDIPKIDQGKFTEQDRAMLKKVLESY